MPAVDPRRASPGSLLAVLGVAAGVGVVHARAYLPFLADDALISLRYARRLADGQGLTWNDGEWVEGYSNLLWVLLLALATSLGADPVVAARDLGLACFLGVLVPLGLALGRGPRPALATALAGGLWVGSGAAAAWAIGGLEQPLVALLVAVVAAALWPGGSARTGIAGAALGALCLTRPDGPVWAAGFALGHALARGGGPGLLRDLGWLLGPAVLAVSGQAAVRWWVYEAWVPNTARVKLAWHPNRQLGGLLFVARAAVPHAVLLAAGGLAVALARRRQVLRAPVALLAPPLVAWTAYLALVGGDGDTFPAWRHVVPIVPLAALLAGVVVAQVGSRGGAAALATGALVAHAGLQALDPFEALRIARSSNTLEPARRTSRVLVAAFGEVDPLLAVTAAGGVPYFTGFRALDMLGLTDREVALRLPDDLGAGWMGHELVDPDSVAARAPDLVLFGMAPGTIEPANRAGRALTEHPAWAGYAPVWLEGAGGAREGVVALWVRRDGRAGLRAEDGGWRVPAGLLGSSASRPARVRPGGGVELRVTVDAPGSLDLEVPSPGPWSLDVQADGPVLLAVSDPDGGILAEGEAPLPALVWPERVRILLRPRGEEVAVWGLRLEPAPAAVP